MTSNIVGRPAALRTARSECFSPTLVPVAMPCSIANCIYPRSGRRIVSAAPGRGFRRKARKGGTTAVVIRGNPDGSLKVTESRVLSASGVVAAMMRVSLAWMIGFMGLFGALTGAKGGVHAAPLSSHGRPYSISLTLPPLGALLLSRG